MMMSSQSQNSRIQQWRTALSQGLDLMDMHLSSQQQTDLVAYLALLNQWNRVFNLTAVRDPAQMVERQLLDSLSILPWVRGPRVLDVGAGAGLPGIPLAIARPDWVYVLLDANGKKTRFMQQAVAELGLRHVSIAHSRVEAYRDEGFQTITSRAFADVHRMMDLTRHLIAVDGQWAAMKAGLDELKREPLPEDMRCEVIELQTPRRDLQRHLLRIFKRS